MRCVNLQGTVCYFLLLFLCKIMHYEHHKNYALFYNYIYLFPWFVLISIIPDFHKPGIIIYKFKVFIISKYFSH